MSEKNPNTEIEGPFTKMVIEIEYDDVAKRDTLHIRMYDGESLKKSLLVSTRVSPLDGAVLMLESVY